VREAFCAGQGFGVIGGDSCATEGEPRAYAYALCSCSDYSANGSLEVRAFHGSPEQPAEGAGDVGINGDFNVNASVSINGALRSSGQVILPTGVDLITGAGTASGVAPPCDCAPEHASGWTRLIGARQLDNDNLSIGLMREALDGVPGDGNLSLPCGRFALSRIAAPGSVHIDVSGRAALFVEGNLEIDGSFEVAVAPGASLELFVGGNMRVAGAMQLGDESRGQASIRLHVAGGGSLNLQGISTLAGVLDAPFAELVTGESFHVFGSVFVRRAAPDANLSVHYDTQLGASLECPP
jgi:hypothetical protein